MEERIDTNTMLDMMLRPAFRVENGIVSHVNQAASEYLILPGTPFESLIAIGSQEYREFTDGCLHLTLQLGSRKLGASVTRDNGVELVFPEQQEERSELRTIALAAKALREPLAGMMASTNRLFPMPSIQDDPEAQAHSAQINRRMFQMIRIVGNMADAAAYVGGTDCREYVDICSFLDELFQKAATLLGHAGLKLVTSLPQTTLFLLADRDKLERAIYNLLSNAAKFTPEGGTIHAQLVHRGKRLYLSITDSGSGMDPQVRGNVYTQFLREPALEDLRNGIGLGMVLVRSTAALHGGTVLIDQPEGMGTRVTMTLELRHPDSGTVRSPILRLDYAGEWDHAMVELSDVLPASLYTNDQMI